MQNKARLTAIILVSAGAVTSFCSIFLIKWPCPLEVQLNESVYGGCAESSGFVMPALLGLMIFSIGGTVFVRDSMPSIRSRVTKIIWLEVLVSGFVLAIFGTTDRFTLATPYGPIISGVTYFVYLWRTFTYGYLSPTINSIYTINLIGLMIALGAGISLLSFEIKRKSEGISKIPTTEEEKRTLKNPQSLNLLSVESSRHNRESDSCLCPFLVV